MSIKNIARGHDVALKLLRGVEIAAETICSTLGPKGRNVAIEQVGKPPRITKDGVSVAKEIHLEDPFENMGAELLAQISQKTCDDAGDGTTTASLLAYTIFKEGVKAVSNGANPVDVKKGIDKTVEEVVALLKEKAIPIEGEQHLKQIATISANGDEYLGELLAKAYTTIGDDGIITLVEGNEAKTVLEFQEGIHMARGFHQVARSCITHPQTDTCEYRNCAIFFHESSFATMEKAQVLLEACARLHREGKSVIILADSFSVSPVLTAINKNNAMGVTQICPIELPPLTEERKSRSYRRDFLEDFAVLTGGQIMKAEEGGKFSTTFDDSYFGYCESVVVSRENTIIIGAKGDKDKIAEYQEGIKQQQKTLRAQVDYDKELDEVLSHRLRNFNPMAIIRAGGVTAIEVQERKDRIEDAMHATRAAIEEGIVAGGGTALLRAQESLEWLKDKANEDISYGREIVLKALSAPARKIIENAGKNFDVIKASLNMSDAVFEVGYDARSEQVTNLINDGVIDPVKVVRCCLENAASIAGLLLTTEALIAYKERELNPLGNLKLKG